jgi:hypothetical protein
MHSHAIYASLRTPSSLSISSVDVVIVTSDPEGMRTVKKKTESLHDIGKMHVSTSYVFHHIYVCVCVLACACLAMFIFAFVYASESA